MKLIMKDVCNRPPSVSSMFAPKPLRFLSPSTGRTPIKYNFILYYVYTYKYVQNIIINIYIYTYNIYIYAYIV